jgi:phage terminase large subunit GpA-like protein
MVKVKPTRPASLSKWIEDTVRLPAGLAAQSGPIKLHPYQRAIADAIADPAVERVSVLKSARIGFTTILVGGIAHFIVREPSPILVLMPTESDARGLMVDDIEGLFLESPALRDKLPMPHPGRSDRNTLVHRLFKGGSLKIVAAGAPRNMRRHSARVLLIDEVDAAQVTAGGRCRGAGDTTDADVAEPEDSLRRHAARSGFWNEINQPQVSSQLSLAF